MMLAKLLLAGWSVDVERPEVVAVVEAETVAADTDTDDDGVCSEAALSGGNSVGSKSDGMTQM